MTDMPIEASPEDVAEQREPVTPDPLSAEEAALTRREVPWDADPADVADQLAEVPIDDDSY